MNLFLLLPADQKYDNDDAHQKKKKNKFHALYFVFNFFSKKNFFIWQILPSMYICA